MQRKVLDDIRFQWVHTSALCITMLVVLLFFFLVLVIVFFLPFRIYGNGIYSRIANLKVIHGVESQYSEKLQIMASMDVKTPNGQSSSSLQFYMVGKKHGDIYTYDESNDINVRIITRNGQSSHQPITITSDGKVGMGTVTPRATLDVVGDVTIGNMNIKDGVVQSDHGISFKSDQGIFMNNRMRITNEGTFFDSPVYHKKRVYQTVDISSHDVKQVIENGEALPWMTKEIGGEIYIDMHSMTPVLMGLIKEMKHTIEKQKQKIAILSDQ
jgi:hypothetical protein